MMTHGFWDQERELFGLSVWTSDKNMHTLLETTIYFTPAEWETLKKELERAEKGRHSSD